MAANPPRKASVHYFGPGYPFEVWPMSGKDRRSMGEKAQAGRTIRPNATPSAPKSPGDPHWFGHFSSFAGSEVFCRGQTGIDAVPSVRVLRETRFLPFQA